MKPLSVRFALLCATLALAGCGGAATPQATLREYADALEQDRFAVAQPLLSPALRAASTDAQLRADFDRRVQAGRAFRRSLARAADSDAVLTAALPYSRSEELTLAFIGGAWRITGGVADQWDRSTPRAAVVAFIRAVQADDAAALLALVPQASRGWTDEAEVDAWLIRHRAELDEMCALLESSLQRPVVASGNGAVVTYGSSTMQLAREGDAWVIVDFE